MQQIQYRGSAINCKRSSRGSELCTAVCSAINCNRSSGGSAAPVQWECCGLGRLPPPHTHLLLDITHITHLLLDIKDLHHRLSSVLCLHTMILDSCTLADKIIFLSLPKWGGGGYTPMLKIHLTFNTLFRKKTILVVRGKKGVREELDLLINSEFSLLWLVLNFTNPWVIFVNLINFSNSRLTSLIWTTESTVWRSIVYFYGRSDIQTHESDLRSKSLNNAENDKLDMACLFSFNFERTFSLFWNVDLQWIESRWVVDCVWGEGTLEQQQAVRSLGCLASVYSTDLDTFFYSHFGFFLFPEEEKN